VKDSRDLIAELVAADEAAGEAQTFQVYQAGGGRKIVGHPGWPNETTPPSQIEVDELEERGWVRIERTDGMSRIFAITVAGRDAGRARSRALAAGASSAVVLDWRAVTPVLDALWEAYTANGAPEYGVATATVLRTFEDSAGAGAAVRELVRGGYLETVADSDQSDIPQAVRPLPLTFQLLAGWPGGTAEAALDELVAALDKAIEGTEPGEEQSKLIRVRDGLLSAARDIALTWLERKMGA
jgi:hypothetical protein